MTEDAAGAGLVDDGHAPSVDRPAQAPGAGRSGPPDWNDLARHSFFGLAIALEGRFPDAPEIGLTTRPGGERVRFRANPTLGFPPEEISAVGPRPGRDDDIDVIVNLLGLYGPSSPLPAHLTERIIHAEGEGALGEFLDFFNHRLLSLLFRVWKQYRHHYRYADGALDQISDAIIALFGWHAAPREAVSGERTLLLPFAGLLAMGNHSAAVVEGILRHAFGVPVQIEEFQLREISIPEEERFRPGVSGLVLGETTIAGETTLDALGQFRILLGPLDLATFRRFLPGQPAHGRLQTLVRLAIRDPLAWETVLRLAPDEVRPMTLGTAELGWTSWLDGAFETPVEVELSPVVPRS